MPLVIIKEFETESIFKGYHAYMDDWTPILGKNLSARSEPKNEIHKYNAAATKHTQVIGHLKNFLSLMLVDTLKLFFTSYELIQ